MGKKNDTISLVATSAAIPVPEQESVAAAASTAKARVKKKVAAKKARRAAKPVTFSTEEIALRAYFISEHRRHHGVHGNEHSDWMEAERQLHAEHGKRKPAKRATRKTS
jgi:hypothetical protein